MWIFDMESECFLRETEMMIHDAPRRPNVTFTHIITWNKHKSLMHFLCRLFFSGCASSGARLITLFSSSFQTGELPPPTAYLVKQLLTFVER